MAAIEVPHTFEYRGGQLNAAPVLEVENVTNWKKRNTNNVKDSKFSSLFGKLKYKENLIDSIYETEKSESLVSATPLSAAFIFTSIVHDFQDSPDDEEDTRSSHEFINTKATDQTECHKCGKKAHFTRDCWSKASVSSYQSPFQPKPLTSSQHKPELRPTKDFKAKYNKVKAKLALLSSSASASKAASVKNKGLIAKAYEWDEEEVSSYDNEMVEVKVLMALVEENDAISKEGAKNGEWLMVSGKAQDTIPIPNPPLPIPSVVTLAPQDRWSQEKHIKLVNIIGNPRAGKLTRAMAKELGADSAHECLFIDFLS
ncbi:retrovirus-related pol polyprotein from transposon TNT 1-94 [Tanacetum coccineum]